MIDYYNAFISYKHAPHDIKVAEHVQRSLEHFHIPSKIRKKTGRKKIERIFRDKDELPITSDLTDTISNALEKAEYLIVICSPNSMQSMWVKREIQFFLRNHNRNQVLTVLAEGEPEEVIPDELKYDERLVTNELGAQYTVKIPIEPLSCDYRMPFKKAQKEELPRLAAALIGCSYDELVRRQRAYRMRRVAILFSVLLAAAIAFGGYMYMSKKKIDQAYRDSLISQSRYLANESNKLLEQKHRIDALHLALASLPKDSDDPRPVTAEAVSALTNATLAYRTMAGISIDAQWNYAMGNTIKNICVSPEGSAVAAADSAGNIKVWDTTTHELLLDIVNQDYNFKNMQFINEDLLVKWSADRITAYSLSDRYDIWSYDNSSNHSFKERGLMVLDDSHIIMPTNETVLMIFNLYTGEVERSITLDDEQNGVPYFSYTHFELSPDRSKLGFGGFISVYEGLAGVYDLNTGRYTIYNDFEGSVRDIHWADDSHFLVAVYDDSNGSSSIMGDTYMLMDDKTLLCCYNPNSRNRTWSSEFTSTGATNIVGFLDTENDDVVVYASGNKCLQFDTANGDVLYNWTTNDPISRICDPDGDGIPFVITREGGLAFAATRSRNDALSLTYTFVDNINQIEFNGGFYLVQKYSHEIIYYDTYVSDDEWTPYDRGLTVQSLYDSYIGDSILAVITYSDDGKELVLIDPNDEYVISREIIGDGLSYKILGSDEDNLYIVSSEIGATKLLTYDVESGRKTETDLNDFLADIDLEVIYQDGMIIYGSRNGTREYTINLYDPSRDRNDEFILGSERPSLTAPLCYSSEDGLIYVAKEDGDILIDTGSEDITNIDLPGNWADTKKITIDSGRIVISDESSIIIINDNGRVQDTIAGGGLSPLGFAFIDVGEDQELFIVAYNDGTLDRYDSTEYSFIGRSEYSTYVNYNSYVDFTVDHDSNLLYMQQYRLTNVIDLESWIEFAYIENSIGHHVPTDRFVTTSYRSSDEVGIGYFRHYTLEDLIAKAETILQGEEMSEEMRSQYGL